MYVSSRQSKDSQQSTTFGVGESAKRKENERFNHVMTPEIIIKT
jgi:hypothetical protein